METDIVLQRHAGLSLSKTEKWRVFLEENSRSGRAANNHTNKYEAGAFGCPSPENKYTFGPFCSGGEHGIVGDRHLQRTCVCLCPACLYITTVSACSCMMSSELSLALVVSALSHFNSCGLAEVVRKSGRDKVKNDISHGGGARTLHAACASREVGDAVHRWSQEHHR